ncbi:hypothetical protein SAM23877_6117 [Streptomyces ambofaciens ATCC 23877]|uniref:Uncharacterized protein n=1 Tax=Streptomyces ambofaciens (strain ATCC 23877 / 3486 / DSM 40053 / JCM 4204 / NBRC 12836 / NRRL B-2516) TaxID=278992 RepID=A0A0K2B248_STRA7|nr:hypothetical protein [Streptomyces ambofaciens]AKZ59162.1 hypothetical protein SAM23877_6117 [Streptomyces ambofaciens ATCC 23877]WNA15355.1 putative tail protein [Streptomyces phage Samy]
MRLSTQLRDAVQRLVVQTVEQRAASWFLAKVTVVNANGTVDIDTARGPVAGVRRLKSYSAPAVNDVVKVSRNADGNWIVDGALA